MSAFLFLDSNFLLLEETRSGRRNWSEDRRCSHAQWKKSRDQEKARWLPSENGWRELDSHRSNLAGEGECSGVSSERCDSSIGLCWPSRCYVGSSANQTKKTSVYLNSDRPIYFTAISIHQIIRIFILLEHIVITSFMVVNGKASEFSSILSISNHRTPSGKFLLFPSIKRRGLNKTHFVLQLPVRLCQHYYRGCKRPQDGSWPILWPTNASTTAGHATKSWNPLCNQLRPPSQRLFCLV